MGLKAHPSYFTAARENTHKIETTFATKKLSKPEDTIMNFFYF